MSVLKQSRIILSHRLEMRHSNNLGYRILYFSTSNYDSSKRTTEDIRTRILDASEKYVSSMGWSEEALAQGASDLGLSGASHGQFGRGAVELVEHVAQKCDEELHHAINARADELQALSSWRPRLKLAIAMRLEISLPWHEYRAQALGLIASSPGQDSFEPAAVSALARTAHELARATLVKDDIQISPAKWRARRVAVAVVYALTEVRALSDSSPNLSDSITFSDKLVDTLADAADAPAALQDAISAGTAAATSLGGAALSFLPPKAVGALPHLLDFAANRASSTFSGVASTVLDRFLNALPNSPIPQPPQHNASPTSASEEMEENKSTKAEEDHTTLPDDHGTVVVENKNFPPAKK